MCGRPPAARTGTAPGFQPPALPVPRPAALSVPLLTQVRVVAGLAALFALAAVLSLALGILVGDHEDDGGEEVEQAEHDRDGGGGVPYGGGDPQAEQGDQRQAALIATASRGRPPAVARA